MSKQRWLITYRLQVWGGHTRDYSEEIQEHPAVWLKGNPLGAVLVFALEIAEDIPVSMPHSSGAKEVEEESPNNPYYPHSWDTVISQEDTILAHLAQAPHFFWRQGSSFAIGPGPIPYYARGLRYEVSVLKKLVEEGKIAWEPPMEPLEGNDPSQVSKFLAKRSSLEKRRVENQ